MNLLQLLYNGKRFSRSWTLFTFPWFSEGQVVIVEETFLFAPTANIDSIGKKNEKRQISFQLHIYFIRNTHTTSKIAYCRTTKFEFNFTSRALKKSIFYIVWVLFFSNTMNSDILLFWLTVLFKTI